MAEADRVELAHELDFKLGRLTVSPSRRALILDDGTQDVLEHRVMQVLIALARAKGGIVTRDELTQSCWDSRVVGEDAINRVISRLRKAAETIGADSFRIETVTKIGYRLIAIDSDGKASLSAVPAVSRPKISRRAMITGVVMLGGLGLAAGRTLLYRKVATPATPPEVQALMLQGRVSMAQGTREGANQGIGIFRRVTELAPEFADGWGYLAIAYGRAAFFRPSDEAELMREREKAVARRARELDPDHRLANLGDALTFPQIGHWLEVEPLLRKALASRPDDPMVQGMLGSFLNSVGRFEEGLTYLEKQAGRTRVPTEYYQLIYGLWVTGRIEELERAVNEAAALYPTQFSLWFQRYYYLLYSGQYNAAIVMGEDLDNRPSGIEAEEFDAILAVARAARSRNPSEIERVMTFQMARAREGAGMAENAMQFACLFGRLDEAFEIANAYFFDRGFVVPSARFHGSQGSYSPRDSRYTRFLFQPPTKPMRGDPRFKQITEELGLERYWREIGVQPDYRRS